MTLSRKKFVYKSKKFKKPIYKRRWFWDFVLIFFLVLGALFFFLKTPYFEIKEIRVDSNDKFKNEILKLASGQKNFFLFNKGKIEEKAKKRFPEIQNIEIKKKFPSSVYIKVKERVPFANLCLKDKGDCFLMSEDGIIFKKAKKEGILIFYLELEKRGSSLKEGEKVLEKDLVENIVSLQNKLKERNIKILSIEIFPLEIRILTDKNFKIFFAKDNFRESIETFIYVYEKELSGKDRKKLEYVDLRSLEGGRKGPVYWK